MSKGILVNLTKCIGCGSCTVACKMYNGNRWIDDRAPASGEKAQLADENWTVIRKNRIEKTTHKNVGTDAVSGATKTDGSEVWRYVKHQCLHCNEPGCASACFAKAFQKTEAGPVVYYPQLCVGCRYCMVACPFNIPKFEWDNPLPKITKCMMCSSRVEEGESPACVGVCPTNVMKFGDRSELLKEAKELVANDGRYIKHVYGEEEAGGTAWIYVSDTPFEELGFKTHIPNRSIPGYTSKYMHFTPFFGAAWFVILAGLYLITKPWKREDGKAKKE
ncbi:MAG: 4Fe-4S dicluster domain-containing protein [Planctomycetaceae bacterium]|jgi:formate dehydrogenase iron-sulfur subunit|nr:4Fe-4S dicluster domain-containing protein [Planctomycetaceae bacterium]